MIHAAALAVALAATGLLAYWVLRFRWVLPLEERAAREAGARKALEELLDSLSRAAAVPLTPGAFRETLQGVLQKLEALEPGLQHWIFEEDPPRHWILLTQAGRSSSAAVLAGAMVEPAVADGFPEGTYPLAQVAEKEGSPNGFFRSAASLGVRTVHLRPLASGGPPSEGGRGLWVIGLAAGQAPSAFLLETVGPAVAALWANARELWDLRRREGELKTSIAVTIQELTSTNIRLAQRSREMKTLYEVASTITSNPGSPQASLSALVAIIAKALEADLCAFLLLDEEAGELVTQPGAYGVAGDEVSLYRLPLTNSAASSVRVFLTGRPFVTGSAQRDPQVLTQFTKLWKANSLIVVPLKIEDRTIGILRVGSFKENFFTEDHLRFVQLIAEETAVIIESAMLIQRIAQTAQELANINRMKDEFISTVSHELKTPLTSIQGFLAVILSGEAGPIDDQQRRFLTIAANASARLNALIGDLLDISKLEGGAQMEFKPVDLAEILHRSVEMHEPQAQAGEVDLKLSLPESLPKVWGDAQWLTQVADNLVSNAVKFTKAGGSVLVSAQEKGDVVLAWVSDTGVGIPAKERERVFEKFYRIRSDPDFSPPGTGLGLAIVRNVIEKHRGKVWVESEIGRGSKFSFVVPAAKAPSGGAAAAVPAGEVSPA